MRMNRSMIGVIAAALGPGCGVPDGQDVERTEQPVLAWCQDRVGQPPSTSFQILDDAGNCRELTADWRGVTSSTNLTQEIEFGGWNWNDRITYFYQGANVDLEFYEHINLGGGLWSFEAPWPGTRHGPLAPIMSSIRYRRALRATFYKEADFWGDPQALRIGRWRASDLSIVGNDQISSISIPQYLRVTICSEDEFWGDCQSFTGSTAYVGDLLNDQTSSIIIEWISPGSG
jgi:hypothetical protein